MLTKWDSAFSKNDIRGVYGKDITEELYYFVGKSYIKYILTLSNKNVNDLWITVCRDARNHSLSLSESLIKGIISTGANVVDLGLAPTPIGYYSNVVGVNIEENCDEIDGALIVTASHNPSQYNGLKMTYNGLLLDEKPIQELLKIVAEVSKTVSLPDALGKVVKYDLIPDYTDVMKLKFGKIGSGLKIVVDSANGTGGVVAPNLYRALGCEVIELYSNPDGAFPNHHPNPSDEKTLDDIKNAVVKNHADFGIAFDGDSDRIGIIDSQGNSMTGDKLLLIYALDIIEKYKGSGTLPKVVSEVKCSQVLFDTINNCGGEAIMCKTGHGFIKAKMKEINAVLGGEMSGHVFFKDKYYGFDDAVYAGCRMIEIVSKHKQQNNSFKVEELLAPFNKIFSSQEVRLSCPNELKKQVLEQFEQKLNNNSNMFSAKIKDIITLDGMRIVFDGGFALIRQSNTEPVFTLRFEAKTKAQCEKFENVMVSTVEEIVNNCKAIVH
ncbi:phosphomannomutase/phosphoglucomutase [bacterium]|nr:phosphomannomutase/phosphoglucomutase [bacterium]